MLRSGGSAPARDGPPVSAGRRPRAATRIRQARPAVGRLLRPGPKAASLLSRAALRPHRQTGRDRRRRDGAADGHGPPRAGSRDTHHLALRHDGRAAARARRRHRRARHHRRRRRARGKPGSQGAGGDRRLVGVVADAVSTSCSPRIRIRATACSRRACARASAAGLASAGRGRGWSPVDITATSTCGSSPASTTAPRCATRRRRCGRRSMRRSPSGSPRSTRGASIALAPGGARNPARDNPLRRWPLERYAELARLLTANGDAVLLTGGDDDAWVRAGVRRRRRHRPHRARRRFRGSRRSSRRCAAVVTHDSGPLHIARLVDAPVVGLFGPTAPSTRRARRGTADRALARRRAALRALLRRPGLRRVRVEPLPATHRAGRRRRLALHALRAR